MFFTNKKVERLNEKVAYLEDQITGLRDSKINAQISESRVQAGFNAEMESMRASYEVREAQVLRKLRVLEDGKSEEISMRVKTAKKDFESEVDSARKSLRAEYKDTIAKLESQIKTLTAEKENKTGLYNGSLLVVKALEKQVADYASLTSKFFANLPTVDVKLAKGDNNVTVNSK